MMISNAFNFHVDPVRTEMAGTQQIPILQICDSGKSESNVTITDENLSQVCSTDNNK